MTATISPTVRCGNRHSHGDTPTWHLSVAEVRACYAARYNPLAPTMLPPTSADLDMHEFDAEIQRREYAEDLKVAADKAARDDAIFAATPPIVGATTVRPANLIAAIRSLASTIPSDDTSRNNGLRFALEEFGKVNFYQLDRPTRGKWKGYTFLKIQASDNYYPIKNLGRIYDVMTKLTADTYGAVARYGLLIEKCGHCHRTLTADESRARGIGPVCAGRMGW